MISFILGLQVMTAKSAHNKSTEMKTFFLMPWTETRLQKLLGKKEKKEKKSLSIFWVSTISSKAHIFQELLFFGGIFNISSFFPEPTHRSSTISSLPFKTIITSFQNASVLEHSQGTSWRVHFLMCHIHLSVLVGVDLEL